MGEIIDHHIKKLEILVAEDLKDDLTRMSFEKFLKYHNSSIDCLRGMHGALSLYKRLAILGQNVSWYEFELAETKKQWNKQKEVKTLTEKLDIAKKYAQDEIPALYTYLKDFLSTAILLASDRYRQLIFDFAKDNGYQIPKIEVDVTENYDFVHPPLGKKLEKKLYDRLQEIIFKMPFEKLEQQQPPKPQEPEPKKPWVLIRPFYYLLKKLTKSSTKE